MKLAFCAACGSTAIVAVRAQGRPPARSIEPNAAAGYH
jgi:hypothetical protein